MRKTKSDIRAKRGEKRKSRSVFSESFRAISEQLERVHRGLGAMNDLDSVDVRARAVSRKLRGVGETPQPPPEAGGET